MNVWTPGNQLHSNNELKKEREGRELESCRKPINSVLVKKEREKPNLIALFFPHQ